MYTREQIIEKFKNVHGDKYDYSKVEFVKTTIKVCIICPEHGEFEQTPHAHLKGQGCPYCGVLKRAKSKQILKKILSKRQKKFMGKHMIILMLIT